ncbi:MAG: hypothetical protein R2813_12940 [Flavobacteriales bacterium]
MKSPIAFLIPFLFMSLIGWAQDRLVSMDSVIKSYNENSIYMRNSRYYKGGEKLPYGLFLHKFKKELADSPEALEAFHRYRVKSYVGAGIVLLSVPAGIATTVATASPAGLFVFLGIYTSGLVLAIDAQNQLHESVWLHNRDALSRAQ